MDLRVLLGLLAVVVLAVALLAPTNNVGPEPDAVVETEVSSEGSISAELLARIDEIEPPGLSEARNTPKPEPYQVPCPFAGGPIDPVGAVDGNPISYDLFSDTYVRLVEQYLAALGVPADAVGATLAGAQGAELQMGLVRNAFEVLVQDALFRAELDARGVVITEETVDEVFERQYTSFLDRSQITESQLEAYARSQGTSLEEFRAMYRERAALDLEFKALVRAVTEHVVTEDEMRLYYNLHPNEFVTPPEIRLSQILVPSDDLARNLLVQLSEGASFAELASQYSADASAADGGDMGWIRAGDYVADVEEAAFDLPVGQLSDVVESTVGYHILLVRDRHEAEQLSFEDARTVFGDVMLEAMSADIFSAWYEEARAGASIVAFEPITDAYLSWQVDLDRSIAVITAAIGEGETVDPYAPYFLGRLYEQKIASLNGQLAAVQAAGPLAGETLDLVTQIMIEIETSRAKAISAYRDAMNAVGEDATIELRIAELEGRSEPNENLG